MAYRALTEKLNRKEYVVSSFGWKKLQREEMLSFTEEKSQSPIIIVDWLFLTVAKLYSFSKVNLIFSLIDIIGILIDSGQVWRAECRLFL